MLSVTGGRLCQESIALDDREAKRWRMRRARLIRQNPIDPIGEAARLSSVDRNWASARASEGNYLRAPPRRKEEQSPPCPHSVRFREMQQRHPPGRSPSRGPRALTAEASLTVRQRLFVSAARDRLRIPRVLALDEKILSFGITSIKSAPIGSPAPATPLAASAYGDGRP